MNEPKTNKRNAFANKQRLVLQHQNNKIFKAGLGVRMKRTAIRYACEWDKRMFKPLSIDTASHTECKTVESIQNVRALKELLDKFYFIVSLKNLFRKLRIFLWKCSGKLLINFLWKFLHQIFTKIF